jgi:hypothetical protein
MLEKPVLPGNLKKWACPEKNLEILRKNGY